MYGIDLGDPAIARGRTWSWLQHRIQQLLTIPPSWTPDGRPVQATRLGRALAPTPDPKT